MTYIIITDYVSFLHGVHNNSLLFMKPSTLILFSLQVFSLYYETPFLNAISQVESFARLEFTRNTCRLWQSVLAPSDLCPGAIVGSRWRPNSRRSALKTYYCCLLSLLYLPMANVTPHRHTFRDKGGKSGDAFVKIRNTLCAQISHILEGSQFNTT